MMHPDLLEELDYQANARADYLWEAYGAEAAREARMEAAEAKYDAECSAALDVLVWFFTGLPTYAQREAERKAQSSAVYELLEFFSRLQWDYIPF